jgi:hypothetical protein
LKLCAIPYRLFIKGNSITLIMKILRPQRSRKESKPPAIFQCFLLAARKSIRLVKSKLTCTFRLFYFEQWSLLLLLPPSLPSQNAP